MGRKLSIPRHSGQLPIVREIPDCQTEVWCERRLVVWYDYTPGCAGIRERPSGLQLEPDWPAEVEITDVQDINDIDMLATLHELGMIEGVEDEVFRSLHPEADE